VLVYDADSRAATALAHELEPILPVGYPVVPVADLPAAGVLRIAPADVRGTIAWIQADGTRHTGRDGRARALIACGGRPALRGWAMRIPVVGRVASKVF
jgi:hypothetical protein